MNIYVGNVPFTATEEGLKELFSEFGEVVSATIVIDRETGRSRGFAFIRMTDQAAAERAISELHGTEWLGRVISCNEARGRDSVPASRADSTAPRPPRSGGGADAPRDDADGRRSFGGGRRADPPRRDREEERARERRKRAVEGKERRGNNRDWSRFVEDDDE